MFGRGASKLLTRGRSNLNNNLKKQSPMDLNESKLFLRDMMLMREEMLSHKTEMNEIKQLLQQLVHRDSQSNNNNNSTIR